MPFTTRSQMRLVPGASRRRLAITSPGALSLLFALSALCTCPALAQTTVYVDQQGASCSPSGPGTELAPFCTIADAMQARKGPGVTIIVKPGVYREQVTVNALGAGSAAAPFVLRAQGAGVVIDGADDLADPALWSASLGTTFIAPGVTWGPKQVHADGVRLTPTTLAPDAMPSNSFRWVSGEGLYVNLGGSNPGARQLLVGHRNYGFNLLSTAFVRVEGFTVLRAEDRGIHLQNPCTDVVLARDTVRFANSYGIQTINGQRIVIDGNTVSDCGNHGIGLTDGAAGCTVTNNDTYRNAHPTVRQANGIFLSAAPGNVVRGNRAYDNQDSGFQFNAGSNGCVVTNNLSYRNGDHGFDNLGTSNTIHVDDVAYGNFKDGFSFEGNSPGAQLYNSIAVENGLTTNEFDLWVDASSAVGFVSDHNLFWNSTLQPPVKFILGVHASLDSYQLASGLDSHSLQADPRFGAAAVGDFTLRAGSPAIDAAHSGVAQWPALDASGAPRRDDPRTADRGEGPVRWADLGAFEFVPVADEPPVVLSPVTITVARQGTVSFQVTASDPDGDAITSLVMVPVRMPSQSGATFTPNATHTAGTFTWNVGTNTGTFRVSFIARNALADTSVTVLHVRARANGTLEPEPEGGDVQAPALALSPGFPNPTARGSEFALEIPEDSAVDFGVYDMQGRRVWSEQRAYAAGRVRLHWDGTTDQHQRAGVGVYFAHVRVGEREFVRRIIVL